MGVDGSFFQSYCCLSDHNPAAAAKKGQKAAKCSYLGLQSGKEKKKTPEQKKPGRSSADFVSAEKAGADFHREQRDWSRALWLGCSGGGTKPVPGELWGHPAGCASPPLLTARFSPNPSHRKSPGSNFQPVCIHLAPSSSRLHFPAHCCPRPEGPFPCFVASLSSAWHPVWCPCAAPRSETFLDVSPLGFQVGFQVQSHDLAFLRGRDGRE